MPRPGREIRAPFFTITLDTVPESEYISSMTYYMFRQNNSGGLFRTPAINVIVEASSKDEANYLATEYSDVYFGGVGDCSCCGDRWSPLDEWDEGYNTLDDAKDAMYDHDKEWAKADRVPVFTVIEKASLT